MSSDAWVVVSPHCDDAPLSTYASVLTRHDATVIAVFDGVPDEGVQGEWDALTSDQSSSEIAIIRVIEDADACHSLNVGRVSLSYLDRQYGPEAVDVESLAISIVEAAPPGITDMSIPAAIGAHPDHVAARDAALIAGRQLGARMWLHGDLPYGVSTEGWPTPPIDLDPAWSVGEPVIVELDDDMQIQKLELLRRYKTQFDLLDGPEQFLTGAGNMAHEVLWPVQPASAKI
jgi:LmbE family N-acetylglucosaminyl deacetylase